VEGRRVGLLLLLEEISKRKGETGTIYTPRRSCSDRNRSELSNPVMVNTKSLNF
jgi:hypothetical protein